MGIYDVGLNHCYIMESGSGLQNALNKASGPESTLFLK